MREGLASWRMRDASNASAPLYIFSNVSACAPRTPNCATSVMAIASALPERMRGSAGPIDTARNGDDSLRLNARERNPSAVDFTPGVPLSMKSCASKCERVECGLPAAWMNAADLSWKYGISEASDG